jgi:oligopeptide transport system substrate-binding protein
LRFFVLSLLSALVACNRAEDPAAKKEAKSWRMSMAESPKSLDPRKARSPIEKGLCHLLYDGLARFDCHGEAKLALADSYHRSSDAMTYTFQLKESFWHDGEPLTAFDFEYAWKSQLQPAFLSAESSQLFILKNGRAAKEGRSFLEEVGVQALDARTLVIQLEQPDHHLLNKLAQAPFLPIAPAENAAYNGPYILQGYTSNEVSLVQNPNYHGPAPTIDELSMQLADEKAALLLFESKKLDWIGSPFSELPFSDFADLEKRADFHQKRSNCLFGIAFNPERADLKCQHVRRALSVGLNRRELLSENNPEGREIAFSCLPPSVLTESHYFDDDDISKARILLARGCDELRHRVRTLSLTYLESQHDIATKLAAQWKKSLHLDIQLKPMPERIFNHAIDNKDYDLALHSWLLEDLSLDALLETAHVEINNISCQQVLEELKTTEDVKKRKRLLKQANTLLLQEMPIAPLFFTPFSYINREDALAPSLLPNGQLLFEKDTHPKSCATLNP